MYGGSNVQTKEYHLLVRVAAGARWENHLVYSTNPWGPVVHLPSAEDSGLSPPLCAHRLELFANSQAVRIPAPEWHAGASAEVRAAIHQFRREKECRDPPLESVPFCESPLR